MTPPVRGASVRRFQLHQAETLASVAVLIAAIALVILVWLIEEHAVRAERSELRARIETTLAGQSLVFADQIRREMLGVEQSLRILRAAFQANPDRFDMRAWREQMPALLDVAEDAFIADDNFIVQHDIHPQDVGVAIGARVSGMFGLVTEQMDRDEGLLIGPTMQKVQTRQHLTFMMLKLERPGGWLVGAAYRTNALTRLFSEAGLGVQGMTALIDTRLARIQAIAGPAAADPTHEIARSAMYTAMQARPDGIWIGPSAPDEMQRIHAFRRVPGRQLTVVVAVNENQAMQPAASWAEGARSVAIAATIVVAMATALALYAVWTYRSKHRLHEAALRDQALLENARHELGQMRTRMEARAGQVQVLFSATGEGVLRLDAELRLAEWSRHFPEIFGIAGDRLQPGLPLDELLRGQSSESHFMAPNDLEDDVARRLVQLVTATGPHPALYGSSDGRTLAVRTTRHADGSLLLIVREATELDLHAPAAVQAVPHDHPAIASGPVESL